MDLHFDLLAAIAIVIALVRFAVVIIANRGHASSVSLTARIHPSVDDSDVESVLSQVLIDDRRGKPLPSRDGWTQVRVNSPLAYRLLVGYRGRNAWRRLPIMVRTRREGPALVIQLDSNEGWYARRDARVDAGYERSFRDIVAKLARLNPREPPRFSTEQLVVNP